MSPDRFTVDEANDLLPEVRDRLAELRDALEDHRFAVEQVRDLRSLHGDAVEDEDHDAHEAFADVAEQAREAKARVETRRRALRDLGVEVRDARLGHVDFPAERGGEVVVLCWREGEESVGAWHRREEGITDRRPLDGT